MLPVVTFAAHLGKLLQIRQLLFSFHHVALLVPSLSLKLEQVFLFRAQLFFLDLMQRFLFEVARRVVFGDGVPVSNVDFVAPVTCVSLAVVSVVVLLGVKRATELLEVVILHFFVMLPLLQSQHRIIFLVTLVSPLL